MISDYDTLVAEVKRVAARSDSTFAASIPVFVAMAEDRLYHGNANMGDPLYTPPLRSKTLEARADIAVTNGVGTLPDTVISPRTVTVSGQKTPIDHMTPEQFATYAATAGAGIPRVFTVEGSEIKLAPSATTTVSMLHYRRYDPITVSNKTGPMIIAHGLIYLECTLYEAFAFMQEEAVAVARLARARGMIQGANRSARDVSHAGTIRVRPRKVIGG